MEANHSPLFHIFGKTLKKKITVMLMGRQSRCFLTINSKLPRYGKKSILYFFLLLHFSQSVHPSGQFWKFWISALRDITKKTDSSLIPLPG